MSRICVSWLLGFVTKREAAGAGIGSAGCHEKWVKHCRCSPCAVGAVEPPPRGPNHYCSRVRHETTIKVGLQGSGGGASNRLAQPPQEHKCGPSRSTEHWPLCSSCLHPNLKHKSEGRQRQNGVPSHGCVVAQTAHWLSPSPAENVGVFGRVGGGSMVCER